MLFPGESDALENYSVEGLIGRGGSSKVYVGTCRKGRLRGRRVAIKIIQRSSLPTQTHLAHHTSSTALHFTLHHPSILSLLSTFETPSEYVQVLELCSAGTLSSFILSRRSRCLTESETRSVLKALVDGMIYLAREGVVHRDLKADNILLTEDYRVKLADFGLATKLQRPNFEATTFCGTPNYLSPEVISHRPYGAASDLWALGCLMITMLTGSPPFQGDTVEKTLDRACHAQYDLPKSLSFEAKYLIDSLLQINPDHRIPLNRILSHPFFNPSLAVTPLSPSFHATLSSRHIGRIESNWADKENSPLRTNDEAQRTGSDRNWVNRPILGEIPLNNVAPVNRRPAPIISEISTRSASDDLATSKLKPIRVEQRLPKLTRRNSFADRPNVTPLSSPKRLVPRGAKPDSQPSHLLSPPTTDVSAIRPPKVPGRTHEKPNHPAVPVSALTYDSLTPSASASQIPSRISSSLTPVKYSTHQHSRTNSRVPSFIPPITATNPYHLAPSVPATKHFSPSVSSRLVHKSRSNPSFAESARPKSRNPSPFRDPRSLVSVSHQSSAVVDKHVHPPSPLDTHGLTPQTHTTPHGILTVLEESGDLVVDLRESERKSGRPGDDILKITRDGDMIEILNAPILTVAYELSEAKDVWTLDTLPRQYWKRYRFAARFVELVKSRTPKFVLYTPFAKCTLMSNAPKGDIEVLFPNPSSRISKASFSSSKEPTMRIRLSRKNLTVEISRFVPFTPSPSGRDHRTRFSNATEVTKGEWTKKVMEIPSHKPITSLGHEIVASEREGLGHLEECRAVCEKLEGLTIGSIGRLTGKGRQEPHTEEVWKSFVDENPDEISEDTSAGQVLRQDAWNTLRKTTSEKPSPDRSPPLQSELAQELGQRVHARPTRIRLSVSYQTLKAGAQETKRSATRFPDPSIKSPQQKLRADPQIAVSKPIAPSEALRNAPGSFSGSRRSIPVRAKRASSKVGPEDDTIQTRFLPTVGWCVKYAHGRPGNTTSRYKLMFLDGTSVEIDEEAGVITLTGRDGERGDAVPLNGSSMPSRIQKCFSRFEEFRHLF